MAVELCLQHKYPIHDWYVECPALSNDVHANMSSANIKWGTFLLWGIFDLVIALGVWFLLTETRGLSLEQITHTASQDTVKPLNDENDYGYDRTTDKRSGTKGPEVEVQ